MRGRLVQTLVPMLMAAVLGGGCGGDEGGAPPADTAADVGEAVDSLTVDSGTPSDTDRDTASDPDVTGDAPADAVVEADSEAESDGGAEASADAAADVITDDGPGADATVDSAPDGVADAVTPETGATDSDALADGDTTVTSDATAEADAAADAASDVDARPDASSDVTDAADGPKKCATNAECDDAIFCNGQETCDPADGDPVTGCRPGAAPACDDGAACTVDSCDELLGSCVHSPLHAMCDDAVYCNGTERCEPTSGDPVTGCKSGAPVGCDDGIGCTADACNESTRSCAHSPNHAVCNDGIFCNGAEVCDGTLGCIAGDAANCDDARSCTIDTCSASLDACTHTPVHTSCADGFYCSPTGPSPTGCVAGTPSSTPSAAFGASCERCDEVSQVCR